MLYVIISVTLLIVSIKLIKAESIIKKIPNETLTAFQKGYSECRNNYLQCKRDEVKHTYPIGSKIIYSGNEPDSEIVIQTVSGYDDHGRMLNSNGFPITGRKYYPWLHDVLKELSWEKRYHICSRNEHCHLSDEEIARKNTDEYKNRLNHM